MDKVLKHEFKDGVLKVSANVDTNNDGEAAVKLSLEIDLAEVGDEAWEGILKRRAEKKA